MLDAFGLTTFLGFLQTASAKGDPAKTCTYIDKCIGVDNHRFIGTKEDQKAGEVRKRKIVRPKDLSSLVGSRSHLSNLARSGRIERIGRGLYRDSTSSISENETYAELAKRVPKEFSASLLHSDTMNSRQRIHPKSGLQSSEEPGLPRSTFRRFESRTSRSRSLPLASRFIHSMGCNFAYTVRLKP